MTNGNSERIVSIFAQKETKKKQPKHIKHEGFHTPIFFFEVLFCHHSLFINNERKSE